MISKVRAEDAVGLTLAHDVTKVVPGSYKGPAFRRGHVIRQEDIPELLNIGKEHVFILGLGKDEVHEDDAAVRIARAVMGKGLVESSPSEGRVDLKASRAGLVRVNVTALNEINSLGEIIVATVHDATVCREGMPVAGMRIIPLCIHEDKLSNVERIALRSGPIVEVSPFILKTTGLIITGNEVSKGRIEDRFSPVLRSKVAAFGCEVSNHAVVPDDSEVIARTIRDFHRDGSEVILCSSGMSVDPDDVTPKGILASGAEVRFYGLPVLPGAMFMYGKLGRSHILGVPACVLHSPATAFDRLFPIILTGQELTFDNTRGLGHGGFCMKCDRCSYPVCPFCK